MKKTVISVLSAVAGAAVGATAVGTMMVEENEKAEKKSDKHFALFMLMNKWVSIKQEGKNLDSYFVSNNYKKIAIYGMSYVGQTLVEELKGTDISVVYGIDKNVNDIDSDIVVVSVEDKLEEVDVVVVTAITFFDEIKEKLQKKVACPIVSLENILYEV